MGSNIFIICGTSAIASSLNPGHPTFYIYFLTWCPVCEVKRSSILPFWTLAVSGLLEPLGSDSSLQVHFLMLPILESL